MCGVSMSCVMCDLCECVMCGVSMSCVMCECAFVSV